MQLSADQRIAKRQQLEVRIVKAVVREALKQGYSLSVDDGEEHHAYTTDQQTLYKQLMETDEDYLHLLKDATHVGWIRFVYGNDGWDVICDYSANDATESVLIPANKIADKVEAQQ